MGDADPEIKKKNNGLFLAITIAGQVSLLLVGPVVVFAGMGIWLDNFLKSSPVFLSTGAVIGFIGSVIGVFKVIKIMEKL